MLRENRKFVVTQYSWVDGQCQFHDSISSFYRDSGGKNMAAVASLGLGKTMEKKLLFVELK